MKATNPAAYWNQGIGLVPMMTGAATLMDGQDIREHAERLGFDLPFESVLDVGCGTGRVAQFVRTHYTGVDVSEDAVRYCAAAGIPARLIASPDDLPSAWAGLSCEWGPYPFGWVLCLSVFTHIPREERLAYLRQFHAIEAEQLLVDIIPGDGSGDVALWTADPAGFEADLTATGWAIEASYDRLCPSGPTHRYYRCTRAQVARVGETARSVVKERR